MSAALVIFLENAVDACESCIGKEDKYIGMQAAVDGSRLKISIFDNGMGMDPETRDKIFTLFFSSKGKRGTGIGLFISSQTIRDHGGEIEVESEPGTGTKFTVFLPLKG
jgi:signal transduction histidine kinase